MSVDALLYFHTWLSAGGGFIFALFGYLTWPRENIIEPVDTGSWFVSLLCWALAIFFLAVTLYGTWIRAVVL